MSHSESLSAFIVLFCIQDFHFNVPAIYEFTENAIYSRPGFARELKLNFCCKAWMEFVFEFKTMQSVDRMSLVVDYIMPINLCFWLS